MASKTVKARLTSGWYQVELNKTITALGSVQYDMSDLIQLVSNAAKNGYRASVHAISIVLNYAGTYTASGATATSADINRLAFYSLNLDTPNYLAKFSVQAQSLAWHRLIGRVVNPAVVALDRLHPVKRTAYQRFDDYIAAVGARSAGVTANNAQWDKRPSLIDGIGDDENYQQVKSVLAGSFSFTDVCTIPLCNYSGGPRAFYNDKLPLTMVADPNAPWRLTLRENTVGGNTIRGEHFDQTAITITTAVWVYVSFVEVNAPHAVGTLWSAAPQPFDNSNKVLDAHYYRAMLMMPTLDASTSDNNVAVPYQPEDYSTFLASGNARVFDCSDQVFPLLQYSEAWRFIDHFNIGNAANSNPFETFDQFAGTDTRYKSSTSALGGGVVNGSLLASVVGYASNLPYFPVITNHMAVLGFPMGILAKPGCVANLRVQFDGASLPTSAAKNNLGIFISEYDADRVTAMNYSVSGKQNGNADVSAWKPALDSITAGSEAVKDIVPWTMTP